MLTLGSQQICKGKLQYSFMAGVNQKGPLGEKSTEFKQIPKALPRLAGMGKKKSLIPLKGF